MSKGDYFNIIASVGAVITFIVTYFNKEQNKYIKLIDNYFEKLLVQYVDLYNKDNKINPLDFIKENYSIKDYYIPSYIFYLVKANKKVELHKVLLEDYRKRFPNNANGIFRTIDYLMYTYSLLEVFVFSILCIVPALVIVLVALYSISFVIAGFGEGFKEGILSSISGLIVLGIVIGIVFYVLKYLVKSISKGMKDEYTMKKDEIEELINKKIKNYDETITEYYIT